MLMHSNVGTPIKCMFKSMLAKSAGFLIQACFIQFYQICLSKIACLDLLVQNSELSKQFSFVHRWGMRKFWRIKNGRDLVAKYVARLMFSTAPFEYNNRDSVMNVLNNEGLGQKLECTTQFLHLSTSFNPIIFSTNELVTLDLILLITSTVLLSPNEDSDFFHNQ